MTIDTSFSSPSRPQTPDGLPSAAPQPKHRQKWRWWAHLLVIASFPLFASLNALFRYTEGKPKFPSTVLGLVIFCLLEVGVFAAFWGLAWAFSRATKDELWLRWREGIRPPILGFFYAVGLKLGTVAALLFAFVVLAIILLALGNDPQQVRHFFTQNQPQTDEMIRSIQGNGDGLYRVLLVTLLSFGVAGGREELWRAATMAGVLGVCPASWEPRVRKQIAVLVAAVIFGLGHIYQGWMGVLLTGLLGVALGVITLRHRSVWPAVIAHGFFDAHSFYQALTYVKPH